MAGALFSRTATMQDDETNLFLNVGHEYIIYIYIYMYIYISNFRRNSWVESNPTSAYTRIILTIQTSTSSINQSINSFIASQFRSRQQQWQCKQFANKRRAM